MGHIRWIKLIEGGLIAGLVINVVEYVVNSLFLGERWAAAMRALGRSPEFGANQMALFFLWGFLVGIFAIWLYAELMPRYGDRPITAVIAGLVVWFVGYLLADVGVVALALFPRRLIVASLAVGLVEALVATMSGAWIYHGTVARVSPAAAKL